MKKRRGKKVSVEKKRKIKRKNPIIQKSEPAFKKFDFVAKQAFQPKKSRRCRYRKYTEKENPLCLPYKMFFLGFGAFLSLLVLYNVFMYVIL